MTVLAPAVRAAGRPPAKRARYMGGIGGVFAVASVAGPLLGGLLVDQLSWRWVFFVNLPIGAIALAVIVTQLPAPDRAPRGPLDLIGAALLTAAAAALVLVSSWGGTEYDWGSPVIVALAALAVVGTLAFVARERRAGDPLLPLGLFGRRGFAAAGL